jgi:hypothetical protein
MNLSEHFTLSELTHTSTGLDNTPPPDVVLHLTKTAYGLEEVRTLLGDNPIRVSSGYRSPAVNRKVGGAQDSQHLTGCAVDFTCPAFGTPEDIVREIVASDIAFDQCIHEFKRWVHISFTGSNRRMALVIDNLGTRSFS